MVTGAIITVLFTGLRAVMGLVPSWGVVANPFESVSFSLGGMFGSMNAYFPVSVLLGCLVLLLSLKVFLLGWRVVVFIYHQFWGSN
jgi:hypothetical protein